MQRIYDILISSNSYYLAKKLEAYEQETDLQLAREALQLPHEELAAPVVWRGGAVVKRNEYFYCKPTAQEHDDERIPEGLWEEFDDTFVYGAKPEIGEEALEENYGAMREEER